jgi:hypothetical protein
MEKRVGIHSSLAIGGLCRVRRVAAGLLSIAEGSHWPGLIAVLVLIIALRHVASSSFLVV